MGRGSRNQQQQHEDDIPPPPPPPMDDDSGLDVMYGNANTYSNNHIADDQSVEAQHVVYSFSEDGDKKSSKTASKSRKRWICLMLTVVTLVTIIIALGVVYGKQMQDRKKANSGTTLSEANEAEVSTSVEDTIGGDGSDYVDTTISTEDAASDTTTADTEGDVYITPDAGDALVDAPWGPVTGNAEVVTSTTAPTVTTQPNQGQNSQGQDNQGQNNQGQNNQGQNNQGQNNQGQNNQGQNNQDPGTYSPTDAASVLYTGYKYWTTPPSEVASSAYSELWEPPTEFPKDSNRFGGQGQGNVFLPDDRTAVPTEALSGIAVDTGFVFEGDESGGAATTNTGAAAVVVVEGEEAGSGAGAATGAAAVVVVEGEEAGGGAAAAAATTGGDVVVVMEEDELPSSAEGVDENPAGDDKDDKN